MDQSKKDDAVKENVLLQKVKMAEKKYNAEVSNHP
jgi:hypothetical protein